MFETILAATDGSNVSEVVVERAVRLAAAHGAALHAVSIVPEIEVGAAVGRLGAEAVAHREREREQTAAAALRHAVEAGRAHGLTVTEHLGHGEPAAHIIAVADRIGADLVVVGGRGLDPSGRYVLGSVPERVLFDSHGHDVWVVRTAVESER